MKNNKNSLHRQVVELKHIQSNDWSKSVLVKSSDLCLFISNNEIFYNNRHLLFLHLKTNKLFLCSPATMFLYFKKV